MGIDIHAFNFLQYAKKQKKFGETITIGRQGIHLSQSFLKRAGKKYQLYNNNLFCEDLLIKYFGANNVKSIDNSRYENATYIHNMNEPIPSDLIGKFDTIFDGGCLEHIYNIPQALKNCSLFCKPGGQILHVLPANNFCGHGFWQFSPELFFSLYSEVNGYKDTEVFIADLSNTKKWYKVHQPKNGKRVNTMSSNSLYVLVRTVLKMSDFKHSNIQQSDYIHEWSDMGGRDELAHGTKSLKQKIKDYLFFYNLLLPLYKQYLRLKNKDKLSAKNPGLSAIEVSNFIS